MVTTYDRTAPCAIDLVKGAILGLPDGHLAGDENGKQYPVSGIYELLYRAGHPVMNRNGVYIQRKSDGGSACIQGFEALGPVSIMRPKDGVNRLKEGKLQSLIAGSDAFVDGYSNGKKPQYLVNGKPNPAFLDFDGHAEEMKRFLEQNGLELVATLGVRPTITVFGFLKQNPVMPVYTMEDMVSFAEKHYDKYGRNGLMASEYPKYAVGKLEAHEIAPDARAGFEVYPTEGSTENHVESRQSDAMMDTVEKGTQLNRAGARAVYPAVSVEEPLWVIRKDAPDAVKDMVYRRFAPEVIKGKERMKKENPDAYMLKLSYELSGWDEKRFRLPDRLDKMRVARN